MPSRIPQPGICSRDGGDVYPMPFSSMALCFMVSNPICFVVLCRVPL